MRRFVFVFSIAVIMLFAHAFTQDVVIESDSDELLLLNLANTGSNWKDGISVTTTGVGINVYSQYQGMYMNISGGSDAWGIMGYFTGGDYSWNQAYAGRQLRLS